MGVPALQAVKEPFVAVTKGRVQAGELEGAEPAANPIKSVFSGDMCARDQDSVVGGIVRTSPAASHSLSAFLTKVQE